MARSTLNRIEKIISKALIDSDISHKEFTLVINEEQNYFGLKESMKAKENQLSYIEVYRLIEQVKRVGQNETQTGVQNLLKL